MCFAAGPAWGPLQGWLNSHVHSTARAVSLWSLDISLRCARDAVTGAWPKFELCDLHCANYVLDKLEGKRRKFIFLIFQNSFLSVGEGLEDFLKLQSWIVHEVEQLARFGVLYASYNYASYDLQKTDRRPDDFPWNEFFRFFKSRDLTRTNLSKDSSPCIVCQNIC